MWKNVKRLGKQKQIHVCMSAGEGMNDFIPCSQYVKHLNVGM